MRMFNIRTNIPQKYRQGSCLLMFSFSHFIIVNSFHFPFVSCVHFSGAHRNQLWQMISTKTDIQCNSWLILVCKTASKYNFVFFFLYFANWGWFSKGCFICSFISILFKLLSNTCITECLTSIHISSSNISSLIIYHTHSPDLAK